MNRLMFQTGIALLFLLNFSVIKAQKYDVATTVEYINQQLDKNCKIFDEKKNLRIEYYANGEKVRVDYLFPETINYDDGIFFSDSEGALIVTCYEKAGKCIERDIIKRDSKILYDRSNLTTTCADGCKGAVEAMKHLIKLYVLDNVERTEPFE